MPQALRHTLLSVRDLLATAGPFILIALLLLSGTVAKLVKEFFAKEPQ